MSAAFALALNILTVHAQTMTALMILACVVTLCASATRLRNPPLNALGVFSFFMIFI